ncbi:hypothetical protein ABMA27_015598 [Loxostege sticticalis]|uniref:Uncharacterized protein n=1 Tax=Loxostege sticticalis TaxID=481309 RepID=A0ABR3I8D5_LOXSC
MCDCAEEKARRLALERQRLLDEAEAEARGEGGSASDGGGWSWYSVLGGSLLMAFFAAAAKTAANQEGWAKPLYIMLGLYVPPEPRRCVVALDKNKMRWPPEDKKPD